MSSRGGPEVSQPAEESERKRRLADVFGDVLPETTSDERDTDESREGSDEESSRDRWYRDQVPPHHV